MKKIFKWGFPNKNTPLGFGYLTGFTMGENGFGPFWVWDRKLVPILNPEKPPQAGFGEKGGVPTPGGKTANMVGKKNFGGAQHIYWGEHFF